MKPRLNALFVLARIEIASVEQVFPHAVPSGAAPDSGAARGFAIFRARCIACHAVNREGGHVGPDLGVPRNIVEYRPVDQIKAYIHDPVQFRYGHMPSHLDLSAKNLDDLIAYFDYMKSRKYDPGGAR